MLNDCTSDGKPLLMKTFQRRAKEQPNLDKGTETASDGPKPVSVHIPKALLGARSTQCKDEMLTARQEAAFCNIVTACCPGGLLKSLKARRSSTSVIMPFAAMMEAKGGRKKGGGNWKQREQQLLAMRTILNELVAYYDQVDEFELSVEEPGPSPQPEPRRREGSTLRRAPPARGKRQRNNSGASIRTSGSMQQGKHIRMPILPATCATAAGMRLREEKTDAAMAAAAVVTTGIAARNGTQLTAVPVAALESPADGLAEPRGRPHISVDKYFFSRDLTCSPDSRGSRTSQLRSSRDLGQTCAHDPGQGAMEALVQSVQHLGISEGGASDSRGASCTPEHNSIPASDSEGGRMAGHPRNEVSFIGGDDGGGRLAGCLQSEDTQQLQMQPVRLRCKEHSLCGYRFRSSQEVAGREPASDLSQAAAAAGWGAQPNCSNSANVGNAANGRRRGPSFPSSISMLHGGQESHDTQASLRASYESYCVSVTERESLSGDEDGNVKVEDVVAAGVTEESEEVVKQGNAEEDQGLEDQMGVLMQEHGHGDWQKQVAGQQQKQLRAEVERQSVQMEQLQEQEDTDQEPGGMSRSIHDVEEEEEEEERIAVEGEQAATTKVHGQALDQAAAAVRAEQQLAQPGAVMQQMQEQWREAIEVGDDNDVVVVVESRKGDLEKQAEACVHALEKDEEDREKDGEKQRMQVAAASFLDLDLDQRRSEPSTSSRTDGDGVCKPSGGSGREGRMPQAVLVRWTSGAPVASPLPEATLAAGNAAVPAGGAGDATMVVVEEAVDSGLVPEPVELSVYKVVPELVVEGGGSAAAKPAGHTYGPTEEVEAPGVIRRSSAMPSLTPLQHLLRVCGQEPFLEFSELPTMDDIIDRLLAAVAVPSGGAKGRGRKAGATTAASKRPAMVKVGEGSYGEAWRLGGDNGSSSRGGGVGVGASGDSAGKGSSSSNVVIKVVPIEGDMVFNNAPQKTAVDVISEALANGTLSGLADGPVPGAARNGSGDVGIGHEPLRANWTAGFVRTRAISVCRGPYSRDLVKAWERWDKQHGSENEPISRLPPDQLYWIIAMDDSGTDLERYAMQNWDQLRSVLLQTAVSLAVAEAELTFEHRDLHWGNVLVRRAEGRLDCGPDGWLEARLRGRNLRVATSGVASTVIDFTNSRLVTQDGLLVFGDLNQDPEVFEGPNGDVQFDTYRWMRSTVDDDWSSFCPATNCLWISYLAEVLCKRFGSGGSGAGCLRLSTVQKRQLREFRKRAVEYGSCSDLIWDELFKGLLQADG
ncbi:hypothetical protein VaNZ11_006510 [Volvox africanus]|uniref:non-specific serine/threonine protein kinase n=1 Tax=Volvox africanus TaxID=51714 RepID=A0ABQ5S0V0_9CHLO|nr:hypothetical protein VaNZ11_006510 [Volvox africanus]